jgi:hypothetical protein
MHTVTRRILWQVDPPEGRTEGAQRIPYGTKGTSLDIAEYAGRPIPEGVQAWMRIV